MKKDCYKYKDGETLELLRENKKEYINRKNKEMIEPYFNLLKNNTKLDNKDILDFGCFHGMLTNKINKESSSRCIGLDINFMGEIPEDCIKYDGKYIPFNNNNFDMVLMFEVLEHLKDFNSTMWEIRRILKVGGEVIITTPNKYSITFIKDDHRHWKNQIKQILNNDGKECVKIYSYKELTNLFTTYGFTYKLIGRLKSLPNLKRGFIFILKKK